MAIDPFSIGMLAASVGSQVAGGLLKDGGGTSGPNQWEQMGVAARRRVEGLNGQTAGIVRDTRPLEAGGPYDKARASDAAYQGQADALTRGQLDRVLGIGTALPGRAQTLGDYFVGNSTALPSVMPPTRSAATEADTAAKLADARAYNDQQSRALGQVRAIGDLFGDAERSNAVDRQGLANISNFRQGTRALLPQEVELAKGPAQVPEAPIDYAFPVAGEPDNTLGDVLTGVGRVGTGVALSGWNPWGGAAAGAGGGWSTGTDGYGMRGMPRYGGQR